MVKKSNVQPRTVPIHGQHSWHFSRLNFFTHYTRLVSKDSKLEGSPCDINASYLDDGISKRQDGAANEGQ